MPLTVKEKQAVLEQYCDTHDTCRYCPLRACSNSDLCWKDLAVVDRNYDFLMSILGKEADVKPDDMVNHPAHYTNGGIECIDAMVAAFGKQDVATYCTINAFKYIWRFKHKNGEEDIQKAQWYLNKRKELLSE